jgi:hypothetical protein
LKHNATKQFLLRALPAYNAGCIMAAGAVGLKHELQRARGGLTSMPILVGKCGNHPEKSTLAKLNVWQAHYPAGEAKRKERHFSVVRTNWFVQADTILD